jgi:hypothetical protein
MGALVQLSVFLNENNVLATYREAAYFSSEQTPWESTVGSVGGLYYPTRFAVFEK